MWVFLRRTVIVVAALGLLLLLLPSFAWIFAVPIFNDCRDTTSPPQLSPDGELKAMVSTRDCGATTPISSVVLITGVRAEFAERRDRAAAFRNGSPRVQWSGRELRIFKGQAEPVETPTAFKSTPLTYWNAD
jgi:hypothetical protein